MYFLSSSSLCGARRLLVSTRTSSIRFFSTSNDDITGSDDTTDDQPQYLYGRVKMYLRKKNYGFIHADHNGQDYFCHRSNIQGAPVQEQQQQSESSSSSDTTTTNNSIWMLPYLIRGERVRFTLGSSSTSSSSSSDTDDDTDEDDSGPQAVNVTYEDGTEVPVYRLGYVKNVQRWEMSTLGQRVFDIMSKSGDDEDTAKLEEIAAAYQDALKSISDAQARFDGGNEGAAALASAGSNDGDDDDAATAALK